MLFGKYFPQHNMVLTAALANVFIDCVMHYLHACRDVNVSLSFCASPVYHKHFITINNLFDDARSISDATTTVRLMMGKEMPVVYFKALS